MADPQIEQQVREVLGETTQYILNSYPIFNETEHKAYVDTIISRFKNPEISDALSRVARSPLRKLSKSDRFVKPALGLLSMNIKPVALAKTMAAALKFNDVNDPESVQLQNILKTHSLRETLMQVSELEEGHELLDLVEKEGTNL